jgi:putative PLP-dependent aminotransferase (TIGR04422 family)
MTDLLDYQWPSKNVVIKKSHKRLKGEKDVEDFFFEIYKIPCYMFPSGRAGLSAILKYYKTTRSHIIYAPKWSSHCVWDAISHYANPTCLYNSEVDFTLKVNKWGYKFSTQSLRNKNIADSVDTLFLKSDSILCDSDFEIISLPKILGCNYGGLVITRDLKFKDFLQDIKNEKDLSFSTEQFKSRVSDSSFCWSFLEWQNFSCSEEAIEKISDYVYSYQSVLSLLEHRCLKLAKKSVVIQESLENGRIGSVLPLKESEILLKYKNRLMKRNFNFSRKNELNEFEDSYLLPFHIGVTDSEFEQWLKVFNG